MISVCLPVYNFDVTELVEELLRQAAEHSVPMEILVFDDHSISFYRRRNSALASHARVSYLEFENNVGRSRIRNHLASFAKGDWLLFLDCDMIVGSGLFIKHYADQLGRAQVICGGIRYGPRPFKPELMLRWRYGVNRESRTAPRRQAKAYASFMSGNFLISREAFNRIRFNEEILGYGHEDTLFGLELKGREVSILHIDNPTIHLGLEPCHEFLAKTEQGIVNLVRLLRIVPDMRGELERSIRLLRLYTTIRTMGLGHPLRWFFRVFNPVLRRMLCQQAPSLLLFDLYKVGMLAQLYRKPK